MAPLTTEGLRKQLALAHKEWAAVGWRIDRLRESLAASVRQDRLEELASDGVQIGTVVVATAPDGDRWGPYYLADVVSVPLPSGDWTTEPVFRGIRRNGTMSDRPPSKVPPTRGGPLQLERYAPFARGMLVPPQSRPP